MRHHSMIVASCFRASIIEAHKEASKIFGSLVSKTITSDMNGYRSFFIAPDGSKEDWEDSKYRKLQKEI